MEAQVVWTWDDLASLDTEMDKLLTSLHSCPNDRWLPVLARMRDLAIQRRDMVAAIIHPGEAVR